DSMSKPGFWTVLAVFALAGCSQPSRPVEPAPSKAPEAPPVMAAKAPPAPPAPPVDRTPIVVDLTKVKWMQEGDNFGWDEGDMRLHFYSNGSGEFAIKVPAEGDYDIVVTATSQPALNEHAKFKVAADGKPVGNEVTCTSEDAKEYRLSARLAAGERKISVSYTNDVYKENEYDRNFYLNGLKLVRVK
ncbi:MAG TPA: carbohydrate-binding domain-containing protein, partial [Planctomycetota bacterium]|nr:carbohydrate-binding domain-containing protein [Planctomycetota bacterium]